MTLDSVVKQWVMNITPFIKPNLIKKKHDWYIELTEVWPDEEGGWTGSSPLDERVEWVNKELTKWPGTRRMSWDQWYFDDKRTAEKFLTLYHLIWTK